MAVIDLPPGTEQKPNQPLSASSIFAPLIKQTFGLLQSQGKISTFSEQSIKTAIDSAKRSSQAAKNFETDESSVFNGHDLSQPKRLDNSKQIEVDFYSKRAESRMQRLLIEVAEKTLDSGDMSERFRIYNGTPEGAPSDIFPERLAHDPVFYLVDTTALNFGHPACLVLCWVSRDREVFQVVPFAHPRDDGEAVIEELLTEIAAS